MSYKRRIKKGIPKNTNSCMGCKNRIVKPLYKYEEDTNAYYKDGEYYICKYLNVESSEVTIQELLMDVNVNIYSEEELQKLVDDTIESNYLHYGDKICGLYLYKPKKTGHFKKLEPKILFSLNIF